MKKRQYAKFKDAAIALRRQGRTYADIRNDLNLNISQGTLCLWLQHVPLSTEERRTLKDRADEKLAVAREKAMATNQNKRRMHLGQIKEKVAHLPDLLKKGDVAKIALAMLYWCEGAKARSGSLSFGNSDPMLIKTFLLLLRQCYVADERKLRITVLCRADQDTAALEEFWANTTGIPRTQFYAPRTDARTIGKPTMKIDYKGVCRLDYFSADVYNELKIIYQLVGEGL